ncbi:MAG: outer membrane beta-barrel protein [Bacteroidetes bacterium]|nr:outer membrane beta-barrel protein [Bacteroidota bacterium]
MKKIFYLVILIAIVFGFTEYSRAQQARLNLYSAYNFDDNIEAITNGNNYFRGTIKGGYQWGAGIEYIARPTYGIELLYHRMDTDFDVSYNTGNDTTKTYGLGSNFIMLAGNKYFPVPKSIVSLYGGLMLGVAIMTNKDPLPGSESSVTKFAWGGRAGAEFNFSKNVGLKLHAQLLSAVQSINGGFYLGTGGTGAGLTSESSMYQFGLGGALVISFGGNKSKVRR